MVMRLAGNGSFPAILVTFPGFSKMAGNHVEVDHVLSKMKNLEELIKSGMEITQECALDCEENDEGCPDVRDLKEVMLAYANMIRDINQWGKVAKKTVAEFHKNYDASGYEFHKFGSLQL